MHEANVVVMEAPQLSDSVIQTMGGDPTTFKAGLMLSLASTGLVSLTASAGKPVGVSRGRPLDSTTTKTLVEVAGSKSAVQLTAELTAADLLFYAKNNDGVAISIEMLDTETDGSETVTVTTNADGSKLISIGMEDGASTATHIKAAIDGDTDAAALIGVTIVGTGSNTQDALAETALDGSYAVPGAAVKRHATNGKASSNGGSTGAVYASGEKTGIDEAGNRILCALVDLQAGLG